MKFSKWLHQGAIVGLISIGLWAVPASSAQQDRDHDTNRAQLSTFDQFLDSHPQVSNDLRRNPSLVNDPDYVQSHRDLRDFLRDHPRVREEVKENPNAFARNERDYERSDTARDRDRNGDRNRDRDDKDKRMDRDQNKHHPTDDADNPHHDRDNDH
jgi:hypothetical protein